MKITLIGAAGGEVAGSCYIVQTKQSRVLVDCGLFQGGKKSDQRAALARLIQQRHRLPSKLPRMGETIEL
jgi:predicted metal-dependent RNase